VECGHAFQKMKPRVSGGCSRLDHSFAREECEPKETKEAWKRKELILARRDSLPKGNAQPLLG
jgi:hypothetical protein